MINQKIRKEKSSFTKRIKGKMRKRKKNRESANKIFWKNTKTIHTFISITSLSLSLSLSLFFPLFYPPLSLSPSLYIINVIYLLKNLKDINITVTRRSTRRINFTAKLRVNGFLFKVIQTFFFVDFTSYDKSFYIFVYFSITITTYVY